jgi:hypothetical protein
MAARVSAAPRNCSLTPGAISTSTLSRGSAVVRLDAFAGVPGVVGAGKIRARPDAWRPSDGTRREGGGVERTGTTATVVEGVEEEGYRLRGIRCVEVAGSGDACDPERCRCVVGRVTSGERQEEDGETVLGVWRWWLDTDRGGRCALLCSLMVRLTVRSTFRLGV